MFSCFRKNKKKKDKEIKRKREDSDYEIVNELRGTGDKSIYIVTKNNKKYIMKCTKEMTTNNTNIFSALYSYYHPNIQEFYKIYIKDGIYHTIHEYVEGDDLSNCLDDGKIFTEKEICNIFVQLVDGLDYLHNLNKKY